ncbi:carboxynorspermidine decarboxylase [Campylobacter geochelonis]|uniref:Carboxynorspermidine/carboxyspermidine decarboxylase n=1 Tax=Campylobacter geochelonis TaxID=1780362 RepID=A0A128EC75_9BACT|nr:carboxynorspermidine decarboxylase [Campylobacter geochelonis]QKF72029.1 carboxynorspermidine decarboxylase [Campylobacter geochelonis]CZE45753.1 carboxynorspermidine decarboxylase [Campylobacter geochelonis]CZE46876.1 carboxynorspermidine decarboxylase [Campylobacter geochelonis]CZE49884.1 carboxynorspermidine decarboxylase [Campylobacter geochelonis]
MNVKDIKTPAYVCEEDKLVRNLELLKKVGEKSGAKVLCALKGFAFSFAMPYVEKYLDGVTCSGLHEAKFGAEFIKNGEIHTYSPAFKDEDFDEILKLSNHVVFNSFSQWEKYRQKALESGVECALRINPQSSYAPIDMYNPCAKFSRLGITKANFKPELLDGITGLHFHALCEESAQSLELVLADFEEQFKEYLPKMKWVNFGGGHHITKEGYDVKLLINLVRNFKAKYGVEVYLEPGEAVGWQTGYLVSSVLDIVENEVKIAILDTSAEAHMPDTVLMPYRPEVRGESKNGAFSYRFGGNTCLAGDIMGLDSANATYKFKHELKVGDRVIFEDQIHYTIVKNTTFNGIKLPDLVLVDKNGEVLAKKEFGYEEYRRRN